jgi:FkbM family methyltransferase
MKKWAFALVHAGPSVTGFVRFLAQTPVFALRLLKARFLYFCCRTFAGPIRSADGFIIESPNELVSYWSFFVERECWDKEWVQDLLAQPAPVVLDVGANAGLFTHMIWRMRQDVELIAFEPLPRMAKKIGEWQKRTDARLKLHNVAASNFAGNADFFVAGDNDTSASLGAVSAAHHPIQVPVVTVDSVAPDKPICLMKIDVEGFESQVLEGGRRTAANSRFIIAEAHTDEALARIRQTLGSEWSCKRVGASDFLFRRQKG